jgi:hypothetical protein
MYVNVHSSPFLLVFVLMHLRIHIAPPIYNRWFSFPWAEFGESAKKQLEAKGGPWVQGWHGSKMESTYAIMYHKKLFASWSAELGHDFAPGYQGVYFFAGEQANKANNYARFTPLCGDGIFWQCKWELLVDKRYVKRPGGRKDQWVATEESAVQIVALWLRGCTSDELGQGDKISNCWRPEREADPQTVKSSQQPVQQQE